MIKLVEIDIDPAKRTFDILKSQYAVAIEKEYLRLKKDTNNFTIPASWVYSIQQIADDINDLSVVLDSVSEIYLQQEQTYQLVVYMLDYLKQY